MSIRLKLPDVRELEEGARRAAIAGGMSCMAFYGEAISRLALVTSARNAATTADLEATEHILASLTATMLPVAARLGRGVSFFAEELLDGRDEDVQRRLADIRKRLPMASLYMKGSSEEFRESLDHGIGVLFDALDGTTNFRAGLPLFCTAVAVFLEGRPRVGAIFDPIHNLVYFGSFMTADRDESLNLADAAVWSVSAGSRRDLTSRPRLPRVPKLIGVHLTRSNDLRREEMVELMRLMSADTAGTYMLNTGQLALALVASGQLSAYINNYTNTWDVAAGAVLVEAVGGRVTDFAGRPIEYGIHTKVQVIATSDPAMHEELLRAVEQCGGAALVP